MLKWAGFGKKYFLSFFNPLPLLSVIPAEAGIQDNFRFRLVIFSSPLANRWGQPLRLKIVRDMIAENWENNIKRDKRHGQTAAG